MNKLLLLISFLVISSQVAGETVLSKVDSETAINLGTKLLNICLEQSNDKASVSKVREYWRENKINIKEGQKGNEDIAIIIYNICVIQTFSELNDKRFEANNIPLEAFDKLVRGN